MLMNFDRYQSLWHRHLQKSQEVRDKMNNSALCKNYKFNKLQAEKGDLTIIDRIEMQNEKKKTKDFCRAAFRPKLDHNIDWQCALR